MKQQFAIMEPKNKQNYSLLEAQNGARHIKSSSCVKTLTYNTKRIPEGGMGAYRDSPLGAHLVKDPRTMSLKFHLIINRIH